MPPLLYDLTTLQREANARYGLTAQATLDLAQALYEKHKVLTYPRTDSRHLPHDMRPKVPEGVPVPAPSRTGNGSRPRSAPPTPASASLTMRRSRTTTPSCPRAARRAA